MIKKRIYLLQLLTLLLMTGCVKEQLMPENTPIKEGEPALIRMRFTTGKMDVKTRVALPEDKEKAIESIAVLIFDNTTGSLVSENFHETAGVHSSSGDNILHPNGTDFINIETLTGNNQDVYVIANYHSNQIADLKAISTLSDMNRLVSNALGNPLEREFGLCKIGVLPDQQIRKNTDVKIELKQLSAKITIKVINKCPDLFIEGWTADGLPLKSYVVERTVNPDDPDYHDASDIKDGASYDYVFTDQSFQFEDKPSVPGAGNSLSPMEYSSTFYMFENRRGNRVSKPLPPDGWPNGDPSTPTSRADYQLKAWYAPENATRVRIFGQIGKGTPVAKVFTLNHYLGEDNTADYNVSRGSHYIYTITINSLNSIDIDTNIEQEEVMLEVHGSTDLMNVDAHFASRMFGMHTEDITDPDVEISMEVLQSVNSEVHPDWLNLATASHAFMHVRSSDPQIALWQQEGDVNTYVRQKFIPSKRMREQLSQSGKGYTPPNGVVIGSDKYPDDDTSLPYEKAHYRMSKKITEIPTKGNTPGLDAPGFIYLYIDEYPFEDSYSAASYREAVVRFTIAKSGQANQYIHFKIRQYPPYRFASTPDGNGVLLVERIEEYEHITHAVIPLNLQITSGMQWGKYELSNAINPNNGYDNTLWAVYNDVQGNYYAGTNYRSPKYGSKDGGWDQTNDGIIREDNTIQTIGAPHYNLPATDYINAYHTVYNMTAARYCHEKNRDINGDGNIDPSETFWYLPAEKETQLFWTFREIVNLKDDYYWTSTQVNADNAYAVSMLHSPAAAHQTYSGVPIKLSKTYVSVIGPPRVRCVRRASGTATPIQPIVSYRIDGTTVIDCSNLSSDMYTTESKNNIAQGNMGALLNANRRVYKKLEIQSSENAAINYFALHTGNGKCDGSKGWRLPTQREMLLIYSVKDKLTSNNFQGFTHERYWTMNRDMNAHYIVNFATGLAEYGNFFDKTNQFGYRCVREKQ